MLALAFISRASGTSCSPAVHQQHCNNVMSYACACACAGIASRALRSAGVGLKEARALVEQMVGRGAGFVPVEIPFTPRAKRVLEGSMEEARGLGRWTCGRCYWWWVFVCAGAWGELLLDGGVSFTKSWLALDGLLGCLDNTTPMSCLVLHMDMSMLCVSPEAAMYDIDTRQHKPCTQLLMLLVCCCACDLDNLSHHACTKRCRCQASTTLPQSTCCCPCCVRTRVWLPRCWRAWG